MRVFKPTVQGRLALHIINVWGPYVAPTYYKVIFWGKVSVIQDIPVSFRLSYVAWWKLLGRFAKRCDMFQKSKQFTIQLQTVLNINLMKKELHRRPYIFLWWIVFRCWKYCSSSIRRFFVQNMVVGLSTAQLFIAVHRLGVRSTFPYYNLTRALHIVRG